MYWYLRGTLDKSSRSKVQWNWTFLLVKSFKLVSKPIDKDPRPRQIKLWFSLHGIILEGKLIEIDQKKSFKERSWFGEPKCKLGSKVPFFLFFFFFNAFFYLCCSNFVKMEKILCIEDIVKSTQASPFLTNSRIDMVSLVDPHKVVHRRNAFSTYSSARNGGELEGGAKSGRLKHQFSQVERDLNL